MPNLELVCLIWALRVEEHDHGLIALHMFCEHGEQDLVEIAQGEYVHSVNGCLVYLEYLEGIFGFESPVHAEAWYIWCADGGDAMLQCAWNIVSTHRQIATVNEHLLVIARDIVRGYDYGGSLQRSRDDADTIKKDEVEKASHETMGACHAPSTDDGRCCKVQVARSYVHYLKADVASRAPSDTVLMDMRIAT